MKTGYAKFLSIFLSIVLMLTLFTVSASALSVSGKGTEDDPYTIATAADLDKFSKAVAEGEDFSGRYIILSNNITASDTFAPIGNKENPFNGIFDGNGKKITAPAIDSDYAGLFAYTDGARISNLTVAGEFFAENYAGGIVAYADDTVITGCVNEAEVYAFNYAGGIAGYIASGEITDCTASAVTVVIGYENYTGGIAGSSAAAISGCTNNAYVQGEKNVGGIAGTSSGNISGCFNTVRVEANSNNCGAIAGFSSGNISCCKNTGAVSGKGKTGGIAGVLSGAQISQCLQSGSVSATDNYAGGIAGYATGGKITDSIATANVFSSADYVAGIFGNASATEISRCVFTAEATSLKSTDAAIGAVSNGTVTNCYYNSANETKAFVSGSAKTGATGLSDAQLLNKASYTGFDFTNVWAINEIHAKHPLLRKFNFHTTSVIEDIKATCTEDGHKTEICSICHETIETEYKATGHNYMTVSVKYASCTVPGYIDKVCTLCADAVSETINTLPHTDTDSNEICDECGKSLKEPEKPAENKSIFERIAEFFRMIIDWFRGLFS